MLCLLNMQSFKENNEMNVMISIDSNYILPAKVMLKSLSENVKEKIQVFLLYYKLNQQEISEFLDFFGGGCITVHPVFVDFSLFKSLPVSDRFPLESYSRLVGLFELPKMIDRVLWLDVDIIIKGDLAEFYWQDIKNISVAVVKDLGSEIIIAESHERLHLRSESIYFNSGVILFNLNKIRAYWSKEILIKQIGGFNFRLEYPDQDILNLIFEQDKIILPNKWNYQIKSWSRIEDKDLLTASVIHYVGPIKPWSELYENKVKWIWWSYYCKCFGKKRFIIFWVKNTRNMFYMRYLEKKINFLKQLVKRFIIKVKPQ